MTRANYNSVSRSPFMYNVRYGIRGWTPCECVSLRSHFAQPDGRIRLVVKMQKSRVTQKYVLTANHRRR